jgi:hypothetical protein
MYGKAGGGNWTKAKLKNSLAVKFIFIKSDKNRLFMEELYLGIELSKRNHTGEELFSNSNTDIPAETLGPIKWDGPRR